MTVMQDNIREMMTRETSTCAARPKTAWPTRWKPRAKASSWWRRTASIVLANSTLRGFFPAIADSLVSGADFSDALAPDPEPAGAARRAGGVDATGHAELELADGRWLRMTASATSRRRLDHLPVRLHPDQGTRGKPAPRQAAKPKPPTPPRPASWPI